MMLPLRLTASCSRWHDSQDGQTVLVRAGNQSMLLTHLLPHALGSSIHCKIYLQLLLRARVARARDGGEKQCLPHAWPCLHARPYLASTKGSHRGALRAEGIQGSHRGALRAEGNQGSHRGALRAEGNQGSHRGALRAEGSQGGHQGGGEIIPSIRAGGGAGQPITHQGRTAWV